MQVLSRIKMEIRPNFGGGVSWLFGGGVSFFSSGGSLIFGDRVYFTFMAPLIFECPSEFDPKMCYREHTFLGVCGTLVESLANIMFLF